jgi:mannan endo-1,4-beta-mannosidase
VTRTGRSLVLDGRPYRFVGLNVGTGVCGNTASIETALDSIGPGQNAIRFWFLQQFATRSGARDWTKLDRVVAAARDRNVRIVATLVNQWADCEGSGGFQKTESWYQTGYRSQVQPNGTKTYREWVAEVVARYEDEPTILMWQLVNEAQADSSPGGGCSTTADDTLKAFAEDVAGMIKSIDQNHLVNLGTIGDGNCGTANDQYKTVQSSSLLDVLEIHQYHPWSYSGDAWNGTKVRIRQAAELNKPLFNGEDGILLGSEASSSAERAAMWAAKFADHLTGDGMVGELLWTWHNGRTPVTGHDIGSGDPVFGVLPDF